MKPPRFTLRFLLIAVTIAAFGFGVWRLWPMSEGITESQAKRGEYLGAGKDLDLLRCRARWERTGAVGCYFWQWACFWDSTAGPWRF